jgi:predicted ribosomally synthesized peptide with SipW-like signal peptide
MNTKIIASLATMLVVGAAAVGGTLAYFSDTATISGNTFTAGTMAIQIDSDSSSGSYNWSDGFNNPNNPFANVKPGDSGHQVLDIKSAGTVGGVASIRFQRTSTPNNELPANMNIVVTFDGDHNGNFDSTGLSYTLAEFYANPNQLPLGAITSSDGIASVRIDWSVPSTAGNDIQGDSTTMNVIFGLDQVQQ